MYNNAAQSLHFRRHPDGVQHWKDQFTRLGRSLVTHLMAGRRCEGGVVIRRLLCHQGCCYAEEYYEGAHGAEKNVKCLAHHGNPFDRDQHHTDFNSPPSLLDPHDSPSSLAGAEFGFDDSADAAILADFIVDVAVTGGWTGRCRNRTRPCDRLEFAIALTAIAVGPDRYRSDTNGRSGAVVVLIPVPNESGVS